MRKLFFSILFFSWAASLEAASFYELLKQKGGENYWLKILHFRHGESLADGKDFFFSLEGKKNPEKELNETIRAFSSSEKKIGNLKLSAQCTFVERYRFLKSLGLVNTPDESCPDFDFWQKGISPTSVTLVFSSSFPNDPSSMFGHTFIRFNKKAEEKNDLLDYGANFSALIDQRDGPFEYAFKGLAGWYPGFFAISPYYMKVNEYINSESRDLYEYDLSISSEGTSHLLNHLWEIYTTTHFDYYFVTENCSYILADFLEIGNPHWDLTSTNHFFYLPSDLIKKISSIQGAVKEIHFRPSLNHELKAQIKNLNPEEKELLKKLTSKDIYPRDVKNAKTLDAFLLYEERERNRNKKQFSDLENAPYREALLARASLKEKSPELKIEIPNEKRPELSHGPERLGYSLAFLNNDWVHKMSYRLGPHNQMSSDLGLDDFGHFEFFSFEGSYHFAKRKFTYEEIQLLRLASLFPSEEFDSRFSWNFGASFVRLKEVPESYAHKFLLEGALGKTWTFFQEKLWTSFFLGGFLDTPKMEIKRARLGPWAELSFLGKFSSFYKWKISSKIQTDALRNLRQDYFSSAGFIQTFFKGPFEVRLETLFTTRVGEFKLSEWEESLTFAYYF